MGEGKVQKNFCLATLRLFSLDIQAWKRTTAILKSWQLLDLKMVSVITLLSCPTLLPVFGPDAERVHYLHHRGNSN